MEMLRDENLRVIIKATSDLACPWCYVGFKRLENALESYKDKLNVEIQWHPYIIDKATSSDGEDYLAYNVRRWGGDGWVHSMKVSSRQDGCSFSNWNVWANTLHAHRLMELARSISFQKAHELKRLLFQKYYEEGQNISLIPVLVEIGSELDLPNVESYMTSEVEGFDDVLRSDQLAKRAGISGVPHFEVLVRSQKIVMKGAQSRGAWEKLFSVIVDEEH